MTMFLKVVPLFVVVFIALLATSVHAFQPTAEQIKQFQSLPDGKKKSLLKSQRKSSSPVAGGVSSAVSVESTVKPILPVQKVTSSSDLKPFGYSLFAGKPTTFAPVKSIPAPTDYVLGVGDQLKVFIFGTQNDEYQLIIDRNGQVTVPSIGPVTISGMTFSDAKSLLLKKISSLGVGVKSSITMGKLRSFRIFVLGESRTPGSYLVSGMATITHALYVSGGITDVGSYRNVQLKRRGKVIETLDLYDLLLQGNTENDVRLQPGDAVFIPKLKRQVSIAGEVYNPALYELKHEKTLKDVLALSGGIKPTVYKKKVEISTVVDSAFRKIFMVDITKNKGLQYPIKNGDLIKLAPLRGSNNDLITINGKIHGEGRVKWFAGMSLLDVIPSRSLFVDDADLNNILIKRQEKIAGDYQILKVSWLKAKKNQDSKDNIKLKPRDEVHVLSRMNSSIRRGLIEHILTDLKLTSSYHSPFEFVTGTGMVKFPGQYPLTSGMTIKDLIDLSGGLQLSAMLKQAELYRYETKNGEKREVERIYVDLNKVMSGDLQHNILLQPHDNLMVKQVSDWSDTTRKVSIMGEVAFPGVYTIKPGETMQSVLARAGGFTKWSAPNASVFTREALKKQERLERDLLADELEKSMMMAVKADAPLAESDSSDTISAMGKSLIAKIRATPAVGRLVVGFDPKDSYRYKATMGLSLRDGDALYVPMKRDEIIVMGEVSRASSFLFQEDLTISDYLAQSGGLSKLADEDSIFVVHADGSIEKYNTGFFGVSDANIKIKPGDTIVVPMDVERVNPLVTWTAISKVLANFAVTAATLKTIGIID